MTPGLTLALLISGPAAVFALCAIVRRWHPLDLSHFDPDAGLGEER